MIILFLLLLGAGFYFIGFWPMVAIIALWIVAPLILKEL